MVGAEPNPLRRYMAWLVALGMLAVVVGLTVYARQQDSARRVAEGRADAAETQLAGAQASLTAIARTSAAATATALAESNLPEAALRRHWRLLVPWLPIAARYELAAILLEIERAGACG